MIQKNDIMCNSYTFHLTSYKESDIINSVNYNMKSDKSWVCLLNIL